MKRLNFIYIFLCAFLLTNLLPAQDVVQKTDTAGVYKLTDVVVTATKTKANTLELANSITIIDSAEIENRNKENVFDLLKTVPGVSFTTQGPVGSLSNISIRGGNNANTLVLIDGVKMNLPSDPSNVYDFANLPVDQISRIEVLRGPQSTLYGSDALSGVINIITKKGNGKPLVNFLAEGGSYNSYKGAFGLSGSSNKFNYNISLSKTKTDGFSAAGEKYGNTERDGYDGNNTAARFGFDVSKDTYLNFTIRYINTKANYDQHGGQFGDDPTYKYSQEEIVTRAESGFKLLKGFWDQKVGISYYKNIRKYNYDSTLNNPVSSRSLYDGRRLQFDWLNNFNISDGNKILLGVDGEFDQSASSFFSKSTFGPFESIIPKNTINIFGVYLQDQIKLGKSFFATAGGRYDNHEKFGSAFTYRIAPAYIFWQTGTKIKATIGTGFKAPSFFYLYDAFFGNENLNPEKSFGWDAGIEQYFFSNGIAAGVTYFHNDFTDLIGFDENFKAININKATSKGVEFYVTADLLENLNIKTNYTFTETKDESENSPDKGLQLLRRPKHKVGFVTTYKFLNKANFTVELIYVGKRNDKDFSTFPASRVTLPDYTVVNLSAQYDVASWLTLTGRIDNLFDKNYEDILGYGTPGFSGYAGIKIKL